MYRVKLIKGLSYVGAVSATKENPFVDIEDKAVADAVVASGYFVHVETEAATTENGDNAPEALSKMTVAQLEAYAKENNIDLAGASKKADIIKAIEAATTENGADGEADYSEDGE